jgi:enoyl-CoA hydratase
MSYETLRVEVEDRVAVVTIHRPEKLNALNATVRRELIEAMDALGRDDDVRVVVLTGAGDRAFVAGADLVEFAERTPLEQRQVLSGRRIYDAMTGCPKPTIAMVNGYALGGGCELAMACDIRVAGRSAKMGQTEIRVGLIPGGGGSQRLPRLVGLGQAMRMALTGDILDAAEALRIGLVDVLVDDDELHQHTLDMARRIAAHSPVALRLAKEALQAAAEAPLAEGLRLERELFVTAFASEDRQEGVNAFLEKRTPEFRGR